MIDYQIDSSQCRAARALLHWSQGKLAGKSDVSKKAIADFEREVSSPQKSTLKSIKSALFDEGIEFIEGGVKFNEKIT